MHWYYNNRNIIVLSHCRIRTCDPTGGYATTGVIMALTAAAGVTAAYGKREEGISQANQYRYAASVMDRQAEATRRTADINKSQVQYGASLQAKSLGEKVAEVTGAQKAAIGANIGGGSVTGADIIKDTMTKSKMDELAIRYNAEQKNWGIENEAQNEIWSLNTQKKQYLQAAKNARRAGNIGAMTSLLSTATSTASAYNKYNFGTYGRTYTSGYNLVG